MNTAFDEGHLDSGDGHCVWYGQYGRRDGVPLFWLHGGPGSGASLRHRELVDLARYRLVLADQRGAGRSRPAGGLARNDTQGLVDDIERLRAHLGLQRILLGGGSWGATLALAYAARHAGHLLGLVLRAPFLATAGEVNGFLDGDDCRQAFAGIAPEAAPPRLLPWLADRLASSDAGVAAPVARAWRRHELRLEGGGAAADVPDRALIQRYRLQAHYLLHGCFLDSAALLAQAGALRLPVAILHGQADRICPPDTAVLLHRRIAGSRLRRVASAGHDPFHPAMASALGEALARFAAQGDFEGWGERDA